MSTMIWTGSNQRIPEYHAWTALCVGLGAKTYVELGAGSSHEQAEAGMKVVTVDILPNGLGGIEHVQGSSHDLETLHKVLSILGDRPDIVFIDADHETEAVRMDFDMWYPAAKIAVGFHDVAMASVSAFWEEVCKKYPSVQLMARDHESAIKWQTHHQDGLLGVGAIGIIFK